MKQGETLQALENTTQVISSCERREEVSMMDELSTVTISLTWRSGVVRGARLALL